MADPGGQDLVTQQGVDGSRLAIARTAEEGHLERGRRAEGRDVTNKKGCEEKLTFM